MGGEHRGEMEGEIHGESIGEGEKSGTVTPLNPRTFLNSN